MSLRIEMMEVLNSKFKDKEFTSDDLQVYFPSQKRKAIQKMISILIGNGVLTKVGFKQNSPNKRFNVYWLGKKPFKHEEVVKKDIRPEWAKAWPNVWKGMQR